MQIGDFPENANPAGYYPDKNSAVITWTNTECGLWMGGFKKAGVTVTVKVNNSALTGFTDRKFKTVSHNFISLDGKVYNTNVIGELGLYHRGLGKGTFTMTLIYESEVRTYKIIVQ